MAKLTRKTVILAKIESSYGVDPTPTGGANAILIINPEITPIAAEMVGREYVRETLGNFDQLVANKHVEITFEVEIAGSGTAGTAPAYGPLLRACGMSETALASAVTGTAAAGSSTTITLAGSASASDDAYNGMLLTTTGGTGSGQTALILDYNGTTKVATVAAAFGVTPDATTTYSIGANVVYRPVSSGFESVTIYFNKDGIRHILTGARGTVELSIEAAQIPRYRFSFVGIYNTVTDAALPSTTLSAFQYPLVANATNTPQFLFFGVTQASLAVQSLSMNLNVSANFRALIGTEYVQISDRRSEGTAVFEATALSTLDVFGLALGSTNGEIRVTHGTAAGNKVMIASPRADIGNPTYSDDDGNVMWNVPYSSIPQNGGDEVFISVF